MKEEKGEGKEAAEEKEDPRYSICKNVFFLESETEFQGVKNCDLQNISEAEEIGEGVELSSQWLEEWTQ